MIEIKEITKKFADKTAIDKLSCTVKNGCIYGLVGANGSGKSTLLRTVCGIYKPDSGQVLIDGAPVWENAEAKAKIAFVSDEPYFPAGVTLSRMMKLYGSLFPDFDREKFKKLASAFSLDLKKRVSAFSKGMRRQAATALALSRKADYMLFDETFDGLDPIARGYVKNLISEEVMSRGAAAVITSHSLRELEDTCDQLALLHNGGLVLESDIADLKTTKFKVQIAFSGEYDRSLFGGIDVLHYEKHGAVCNMIVQGDRDETEKKLKALQPLLLDVLPLSLEEVFTYEAEALGYAFSTEDKEETK